ncbi:MAG: hypothetical protein WBY94_29980 [Polyangiaceae bacterium]
MVRAYKETGGDGSGTMSGTPASSGGPFGTTVRMAVRRLNKGFFDDDLDRSLQDASGGKQRFGDLLEAIRATPHDNDFKASLVIEVHVHRRADLIAQLVLQLRQVLAELPNVMVVDDGHAGKRFDASGSLGPDDFRPS